jgi:hypothetical protein
MNNPSAKKGKQSVFSSDSVKYVLFAFTRDIPNPEFISKSEQIMISEVIRYDIFYHGCVVQILILYLVLFLQQSRSIVGLVSGLLQALLQKHRAFGAVLKGVGGGP